jgi:hypothetical protein
MREGIVYKSRRSTSLWRNRLSVASVVIRHGQLPLSALDMLTMCLCCRGALRGQVCQHARLRPPRLQAALLRRQLPALRGGVWALAALPQPQVPQRMPQRALQVNSLFGYINL